MKRFYNVVCAKCKYKFKWDRLNPKSCQKCGSRQGFYKRHYICLKEADKKK